MDKVYEIKISCIFSCLAVSSILSNGFLVCE